VKTADDFCLWRTVWVGAPFKQKLDTEKIARPRSAIQEVGINCAVAGARGFGERWGWNEPREKKSQRQTSAHFHAAFYVGSAVNPQ
jgi:hypothetical protein